ncbi:MAG: hypothetical protein IH880_05360 [Candidatus Marinimicrobia bacterium]|nr:hypothetical protein [Candidatus Neomarinimicrobiota bacterium]
MGKELKNELEENIKFLVDHTEFANKFSDVSLQNMINALQHLKSDVDRMKSVSDPDFINTKQNIINSIRGQIDSLLIFRPAFITEKWESTGLMDEAGVSDKLRKTEAAVDSRIKQLDKKLEELDSRESKLRQTAAGISVEEAQKQFSDAAVDQQEKIDYWEKISAGSLILFFGFALILWFTKPDTETIYDSIYFTTIRITILITIGAFIAFSLKILRAHMHMKELNKHRERLSNSLPAFVEAVTENHRDIIITNLVDAISSFGKSGLLQKEDDSMSIPKIVVDTMSKNISGGN